MGWFGSIQDIFQSDFDKMAFDGAEKLPLDMVDLKVCETPAQQEALCRRIQTTMQTLKSLSSSGKYNARKAQELYDKFCRVYREDFESHHIQWQ